MPTSTIVWRDCKIELPPDDGLAFGYSSVDVLLAWHDKYGLHVERGHAFRYDDDEVVQWRHGSESWSCEPTYWAELPNPFGV